MEAGRLEAAGDAPSFILRVVQLRAVEANINKCSRPSYDQYLAVFEQRRCVTVARRVEVSGAVP
jgi:hypothetical protein